MTPRPVYALDRCIEFHILVEESKENQSHTSSKDPLHTYKPLVASPNYKTSSLYKWTKSKKNLFQNLVFRPLQSLCIHLSPWSFHQIIPSTLYKWRKNQSHTSSKDPLYTYKPLVASPNYIPASLN